MIVMFAVCFSAYYRTIPIMSVRRDARVHIDTFNQFVVFKVVDMLNLFALFGIRELNYQNILTHFYIFISKKFPIFRELTKCNIKKFYSKRKPTSGA